MAESAPASSETSAPAPASSSPTTEVEVSPYKRRSIAELIDEEKTVRVVTLDAPMENTFTEHDLRRWSLNFERPTIVRGLFTPPKLDSLDSCEFFLPKKTKVFANSGQIGHFQDGNGKFTWSDLWKDMMDGKNIYGSFGTGTSNGGMDYGNQCLNANPFTTSILNLREKYMPEGMGKKNDYPGHVIFGCSKKMKVSSNWHNAIDANLLFQLYGTKEWYTCEKLPKGFAPYQVAPHAFGVVTEDIKLEETFDNHKNSRKLNDIFPQSAHLTLQPGDMLINPPFSWHAIKVDQMSISLSLRGDKEDVISWLAYRYFDGNVDHPLMLSFSYFFHEYGYMKLRWSSWNLLANAGQMLLVSVAFMSPRVIMLAYVSFAKKCLEKRKQIAEYFDRYE